jgi:hypothetical protein
MSITDLVSRLREIGVVLVADGERLMFHPRSAVTPELLARLQAHKDELLASLGREGAVTTAMITPSATSTDATSQDSPNDSHQWIEEEATDGRWSLVRADIRDLEAIEPPAPCTECGGLDLWQTLAGNWRCLRCDPPVTARRLRAQAAQLRNRRPSINKNERRGRWTTQQTAVSVGCVQGEAGGLRRTESQDTGHCVQHPL